MDLIEYRFCLGVIKFGGFDQQIFFARKRSGSGRYFLRESAAVAQQQNVGHSVVVTIRGVFRL